MKEQANWLTYLSVTVILTLAELLYFKLADRFNIIDKPNQRSSHHIPTIRGGGIVFSLSVILFSIFDNFPYPALLTGICLSALISFVDDIREVNPAVRFSVHLITVSTLLYEVSDFIVPWWAIFIFAFIALGAINMYNFMDGINGMTSFYTLSILLPLMVTETDSTLFQMQVYFGISVIVFTWFNARKRARCFAGDIGSITAAVILLFFTGQRMIQTQSLVVLGLFSLYAIDTGYTLIERWLKKENILQAHRSHLYQLLCNEYGINHLHVSLIYATLQLGINGLILWYGLSFHMMIFINIELLILYHLIKTRIKDIHVH